jgi:hypothetical protein
MIAQKEITWKIQMMAQKEIAHCKKKNSQKGKMAPAPKEKQKSTKSESKNRVPHIMEGKNRGMHI